MVSWEQLDAILQERQAVYKKLSDEERAEVDAFNNQTSGKPIPVILEMGANQPDGRHPFMKYLERAGVASGRSASPSVPIYRM